MTKPTVERLKELLHYEPETGAFTWRVKRGGGIVAGDDAGAIDGNGYLHIKIDGKTRKAHRLAWLYIHGEWPETSLDHMNRDKLDNRISNLRLATCAQNQQNCKIRKDSTSNVTGVQWHKHHQKWQARIQFNKQEIHLGYFGQFDEAVDARKTAERQYHPFNTGI